MVKASWTDAEWAILRREWPKGGWHAVKELLPGRSYNAVRGAADRLGLHVTGRTYCKQPTTEWIDAAIGRAYRTGRVDKGRHFASIRFPSE